MIFIRSIRAMRNILDPSGPIFRSSQRKTKERTNIRAPINPQNRDLLYPCSLNDACAAANLATGTLNGEQLT